jgi:hypothetical protein
VVLAVQPEALLAPLALRNLQSEVVNVMGRV